VASLWVRVTPRGGRDRIEGWMEGADGRPLLRVRVSAAPTDGEANAAVTKLIAKALGVRPTGVTVAAGQTARLKRIEAVGADEAAIEAAFGRPSAG
jgi:uncharacterized protein YggU (UPF0235/DUF167 family)